MSFSMFIGRVVLPAVGLAIATVLVYQAVRTGRLELPALSAPVVGEGGAARPPRPAGPRRVVAEGRVVARPGAQVVVGSEIAGTVARVLVGEKSAVRKGDLLVEFKADDVRVDLDEATARLAEAEAEVVRVEKEETRLQALTPRSPAYKEDLERGHLQLLGYRARRDALKAARARLELTLRKHRVVAPIDGVIIARTVQPGETVGVAAPLVTIVDLSRLRIEAEVDEYDVGRMGVSHPATISTEAFPGRSWQGEVEEVADALVGRQIRPEDPGRPTDTRVLPVRIAVRGTTPLRLGQRVEVEIGGEPLKPPPKPPVAASRPPGSERATEPRPVAR
jgi:HlyD family secretion protein